MDFTTVNSSPLFMAFASSAPAFSPVYMSTYFSANWKVPGPNVETPELCDDNYNRGEKSSRTEFI